MSNQDIGVELGDKYKDVAEKLIKKYPKAFEHIDVDKILFLRDTKKRPKNKFADIRKVGYPYNFFTEHKFIMTFYENNMEPLAKEPTNMVVFHELMHISYDFEKLVKHNVQDFDVIVDKYGSNWAFQQNLPDILEDNTVYANDNLGRENINDDC